MAHFLNGVPVNVSYNVFCSNSCVSRDLALRLGLALENGCCTALLTAPSSRGPVIHAVPFVLSTDSPTDVCLGLDWVNIYTKNHGTILGSDSSVGHDENGEGSSQGAFLLDFCLFSSSLCIVALGPGSFQQLGVSLPGTVCPFFCVYILTCFYTALSFLPIYLPLSHMPSTWLLGMYCSNVEMLKYCP
jgi:hypothetical protein